MTNVSVLGGTIGAKEGTHGGWTGYPTVWKTTMTSRPTYMQKPEGFYSTVVSTQEGRGRGAGITGSGVPSLRGGRDSPVAKGCHSHGDRGCVCIVVGFSL